ncbi:universal stress protein [Dactylosporangium sp. AC04546]|uniref:universal stress protein n=1 Tax=Dactylosporangium sp. AC04546 TaxID=2862460 RepID=UPI001EDFADF4|nr:universal stress protein [Dactylosporangium sp. AC04546]WVK78832.1 universal stress protein [Dactylosporangium sp. AC04546]
MITGDRRRVVVGVSQSLAGLAAVRFALREARRCDAPLYAVRAWALPSHWHGPAVNAWRHELRAEARQYIAEAFDAAAGGPPGDVDVLAAVPDARADRALVDAADDERDLLVLGARSSWRRLWPSWVVRGCLSAARCPVIVVPPPALARIAGPWSRHRLAREATRATAGSTPT